MLNAWELNDLRATQAELSDKTCTIRTPGPTISGPGGTTQGPDVEVTRVCRVADLSGSEREVGGRLSGIADVMLTLDWSEDDISLEAIIEVEGVDYHIIRVAADSTQPVGTRVYGQRVI